MSMTDIVGAVHSKMRHESAVKHVTGAAMYIDDIAAPPGTQEAVLVLSPHAYARVLSIDTAAAVAAPGVSAIVTASDVPGVNDIAPVFAGEPVLAEDTAEYAASPWWRSLRIHTIRRSQQRSLWKFRSRNWLQC